MRRRWLLATVLMLWGPDARGAVSVPDDFVNDVLLLGLSQPNSMAFLPDGRLLFTEQRTARVRMVVDDHLAATDPALVVSGVNTSGYERGLQGIAVDPAWPTRPYVYVFFTASGAQMKIVRYTGIGDVATPGENLTFTDARTVLQGIPDDNPNHNAGCLRFGNDGMLYVSLGEDDDDFCAAVDSSSLKGQILRLQVHTIPAGPGGPPLRSVITPKNNPLTTPDSNARMVWAYGFRNPWRFQVDPWTGKLYVADVGEADYEEIDEVLPGRYYGWPYREGPLVMPRPECPEPGGQGSGTYSQPIFAYERGSSFTAINCAGIYRPVSDGDYNWPAEYWAYQPSLFYLEHYSGDLRRLVGTGSGWAPAPQVPGQPSAEDWATGLITAADFQIGKDGSLWWISQFDEEQTGISGTLNRIRYTGVQVSTPVQRGSAIDLRAAPNPFAGSTELSLRLPDDSPATVTVHDVAGRTVRSLVSRLPARESRLQWDGRDSRGRAVAPGVYLVRVRAAGLERTLRVLRLR